jgi:hypothetical protein
MNTKIFLLPTLALGGAALLLAPARNSAAFSKIGGSLNEGQRDVRVFDNFLDTTANDNVTSPSQFPGWTGVELAVWKGIVEWGSRLHGNGAGDPLSGNLLGDGGANFDAFWSGHATGIGSSNNNIVSSLADCGGGGTLAFTETPISDGWRIRFCDEWNWDDGPGTIGNRFDIQSVTCHEYGHALGLGHSTVGQATMAPAVGAGSTSLRSIHADDIAGIQCVYGVAAGTKPTISATVANVGANSLTVYGTNFGATGNELWLCPSATTLVGSDPIVRVTSVNSSAGGTIISVTIPAGASPGDVMINAPGAGGATLSNAFPTDLVGTFGTPPVTHPSISSVTPSTIDALIPGTDQTITISGTGLDLTTSLLIDLAPIDPTRYTILNSNTILLDMPQAASLGVHNLGATDNSATSEFPVTIVTPALPKLEVGTGDVGNVVDRDNGLSMILSGTVGSTHRVLASLSNVPSVLPGKISLDLGNNFNNIFVGGDFTIPAAGWIQLNFTTAQLVDPGPAGKTFYCQTFDLTPPVPYDVSNLQSMFLVQ